MKTLKRWFFGSLRRELLWVIVIKIIVLQVFLRLVVEKPAHKPTVQSVESSFLSHQGAAQKAPPATLHTQEVLHD
mgnify:CR=1 FL=1